MNLIRRYSSFFVLAATLMSVSLAFAQAGAPSAPPPSAAELKDAAAKAPTTDQLKAGDPGGSMTGSVADVPASDTKTGLTLGDTANQVGQNKIYRGGDRVSVAIKPQQLVGCAV